MNISETLHWRYTTKDFDPDKKISSDDFNKIKDLLRYSASSINSQPWHFIIAKDEEGKARMAKGTEGFFEFNKKKVLKASHVVLFCTKTEVTDEYLHHVTDQEEKDGRFANASNKDQNFGAKQLFTNIHKYDLKDAQHWMEKQVYLNVGNLLLGAATMGIDAVPMEGIDVKALDEEFQLRQKGFTSLVMVGLGFRSKDDFNAKLPKSRLEEKEIFTILN